MNFSRSDAGAGEAHAISSPSNPLSNRFIAAMLATLAALVISVLGSSQWASADSGTTTPEPDPPRHVVAKAGDESAAVAWVKPAESDEAVEIDGYVVTANPSGITVETDENDTLVIVEGLTNGIEYTFTVATFNENGIGAVSEPSNPITPQEGIELDEEKLERLRDHLRKLAHEARERLRKAEERAREQLEKNQVRIGEWLTKQTERANGHLDKTREKAAEKNERETEHARDWFSRLQEQLRKKLERAEGTDRYEDLRERAAETLDKAEDKLHDRLDRSQEKTEARVTRVEEQVEKRIDRAEDRARNTLQRSEERLTNNIDRMKGRLHDLLARLRNLWQERAVNQS